MKKYYCIIKSGTVINRVVSRAIEDISYPFEYDIIVEDVNKNVIIGSLYNSGTGVFTILGNPLDEED